MHFLLLWFVGLGRDLPAVDLAGSPAATVQETPLTVLKREARPSSPLVTFPARQRVS